MTIRSLPVFFCCLISVLSFFSGEPAQARTLTDQTGRTVQLPPKVQRIIPLGGATRFVSYLKAFDLVVGVEAIETRKPATVARPYNMAIRSTAERLPIVAEGLQKPLNLEAIIALRPDLILTAEADRAQADQLARSTGVPVLALNYGGMGVLDPDKVSQTLLLLGKALNREKRAQALVGYLQQQQRQLAAIAANRAKPTVYIGGVSHRGGHGITSTDSDYFPLRALGAVNIAAQTNKQGHLYIDKEQLLSWNPSVILIDAAGLRLIQEDYLRNRQFYERLSAVKHNRVYLVMPYNNYHTNLELALANSWYLASVLYPAQNAPLSPARKTDELCREFTGHPCYEQLIREFGGFGAIRFDRK